MKKIKISDRHFALVDDEDYERLIKYSWHIVRSYREYNYIATSVYNKETGKHFGILMHRLIMDAQKGELVKFKDGNTFNCQRSNLLKGSAHQVAGGRRSNRNSTSRFKGVSYVKKFKRWRAAIHDRAGKSIYLGNFVNEETAARAYDKKAREVFGPFAYLNFPDDMPCSRTSPDSSKRSASVDTQPRGNTLTACAGEDSTQSTS